MHFCKKYELDQSRTHLLLSELESVQKNSRYAITWKDLKGISEQTKNNRILKFTNDSRLLSLGLVIRYVNEDVDLGKLLRLSKQTHDLYKKTVYK